MGRHTIASSPLRSPAVVVGVPLAAVLATMGSNAVLGGVLPSAEEMPLRAESVAEVPDDALPGPPSWPSSWPTSSVDDSDDIADIADGVVLARAAEGQDRAEDGAPATVRVVRVADRSLDRPVVAPSPDGTRVVRDGPDRPAQRADDLPGERSGARDESDDGRAQASEVPQASAVPQPTGSPTDRLERVSTASSHREDAAGADEDEDAVVDLDTPAGGLSVLSFG